MTEVNTLNDAIAANYMLLDLDISGWTGKETDREASNELVASKGATKDAARVVKFLLASANAELEFVQKQAAALRAFVNRRTIPFGKMRLVQATDAIAFLADFNQVKGQYDAAVTQLASVWDLRVAQAQQNLGAFNKSSYPTAAEIPSRFGVKVDLLPVPAQTDYSRMALPAPLVQALGDRYAKGFLTTVEDAYANIQQRVLKEIRHMASQLRKAGAGEKTRLYETLNTNLQEQVRLMRSMNLADKPEIKALAEKIEQELLTVPIEACRNSKEKAAEVSRTADAIALEVAAEGIWKL